MLNLSSSLQARCIPSFPFEIKVTPHSWSVKYMSVYVFLKHV